MPNDPMYQLRNIDKDRTNEAIYFEAWAAQVATAQVQKQMVQSILTHALNTGCRGDAWLVEQEADGYPFTILSRGTLASAFYDAVASP